jgi:hypothetical protein
VPQEGQQPRARRTDEEPAATNDGDGLLAPDDGDGLLLPTVVNLTATAIARGEEIEREVSEEIMAAKLREHRRVANLGRLVGPRFQN